MVHSALWLEVCPARNNSSAQQLLAPATVFVLSGSCTACPACDMQASMSKGCFARSAGSVGFLPLIRPVFPLPVMS